MSGVSVSNGDQRDWQVRSGSMLGRLRIFLRRGTWCSVILSCFHCSCAVFFLVIILSTFYFADYDIWYTNWKREKFDSFVQFFCSSSIFFALHFFSWSFQPFELSFIQFIREDWALNFDLVHLLSSSFALFLLFLFVFPCSTSFRKLILSCSEISVNE